MWRRVSADAIHPGPAHLPAVGQALGMAHFVRDGVRSTLNREARHARPFEEIPVLASRKIEASIEAEAGARDRDVETDIAGRGRGQRLDHTCGVTTGNRPIWER
jgi:hypothetical protein